MGESHEWIAGLVATALTRQAWLKPEGWKDVDLRSIFIKDFSGHSGHRVYKVSCEGCVPEAVSLHLRFESLPEDALADGRMKHVETVFNEHGLAPKRLVTSTGWFIESWEGNGQPSFRNAGLEKFRELGEFVASIHNISTSWFDSTWREPLIERSDELGKLPADSTLWVHASYKHIFEKMPRRAKKRFWEKPFYAPTSEAASRAVTSHCDLQPANMLVTDDGMKCLDFEFSCVTAAVVDLCCVFKWITGNGSCEKKRAFLESYLVAGGLPAEPADVDAVYLDVEIYWIGSRAGPLAPPHLQPYKVDDDAEVLKSEFYELFMERLRSDEAMQAEILQGNSVLDVVKTNKDVANIKLVLAFDRIKDHFKADDTNGDCTLTSTEISGVLASLPKDLSLEHGQTLLDTMKTKDCGRTIEVAEFVDALASKAFLRLQWEMCGIV